VSPSPNWFMPLEGETGHMRERGHPACNNHKGKKELDTWRRQQSESQGEKSQEQENYCHLAIGLQNYENKFLLFNFFLGHSVMVTPEN
jgi:hypothetical protein